MTDLPTKVLNGAPDVSAEFDKFENQLFIASEAIGFDAAKGRGKVCWKRHARKPRMAFSQMVVPFEETQSWEFPPAYAQDPELPFQIDFVTDKTVRLRLSAHNAISRNDNQSPMLAENVPGSDAWKCSENDEQVVWTSESGKVVLIKQPWQMKFYDSKGRLLTETRQVGDSKRLGNDTTTVPFTIIRRALDVGRQFAASFRLAPDEKIFGCGESFTRLNKRGQKIPLWTCDAHGVQTNEMYKPVPFFMSSRGYGMFVHTGTPSTFDFGNTYDSTTTLHVGDEELDVFIFLGSPKEILSEYTALTGRSPMPPEWSFGLWMSRITYKSEEETREVAAKLRKYRIPCDVVHLDTGWFETDWQCDYQFSKSRFDDPEKMIKDLQEDGFKISLWQLPYFTPNNVLYQEAIEKGYVVRNGNGLSATEDAIIDFTNPEAVAWYKELLAGLLRQGVAAIKVDFGESGPLNGLYANGHTGWQEHNLYPLRYNQAVAEVTKETSGEDVIWARSAWAGSQRYPLHWGGDAENTNEAMASTLRGGLSLGLCGFSFWSHDIGGFVHKSPEELYRRWIPFGMLTSHSRCHGAPPKEPWEYSDDFMDAFRESVELKYRLMPYVLKEARESSEKGWPLLRTLFFEFPEDRGAWLVEDEYMFGHDLLVAPLFEENNSRDVYLPEGRWVDYQSREVYEGGRWHTIEAEKIPCVILVRAGISIPHVPVAQHTGSIDWNQVNDVSFEL